MPAIQTRNSAFKLITWPVQLLEPPVFMSPAEALVDHYLYRGGRPALLRQYHN